MDIFIAQLNQLLASANEDRWLAGFCDLLRTHLKAHVCISARDGKPIEEALPHDGSIPDASAHLLSLPIMAGDAILGRLVIRRTAPPFCEVENNMAGIAVGICTLLLRKRENQALNRRKQQVDAVRNAISALSYSELEAAIHIIRAIDGPEGRLVTGHIADKLGFTRSVVVNALRKLEGAGVIETRSLGVKGMYIRINDPVLVEELSKLK